MYSKKQKCWISASYAEAHLVWCREPFNRENPAAMFDLADHLLERSERGKQNAEAVYLMECAARQGYAQAALAMGQLFEHGWAVQRNLRTAEKWYEKAAALGSAEASGLLAALKRKRRTKRLVLVLTALILVCAVACVIVLPMVFAPVEGILVHSDTVLITPTTTDEFQTALNDLIVKYDDELVISGQRSSNRLILLFEGPGIDLSAFPAATVIANQDNYLVIQFLTEEDAQRCLEWLVGNDSVLRCEGVICTAHHGKVVFRISGTDQNFSSQLLLELTGGLGFGNTLGMNVDDPGSTAENLTIFPELPAEGFFHPVQLLLFTGLDVEKVRNGHVPELTVNGKFQKSYRKGY